eukprot:scaffold5441_cov97-Isochrysis_galbana.AAC.2
MLPNDRVGKEPRRGPAGRTKDLDLEAWGMSCHEMLNANAKCLTHLSGFRFAHPEVFSGVASHDARWLKVWPQHRCRAE